MKKFDIITFGSASEDIFITSKDFFKKDLKFSIGDKTDIDEIYIRTGGGGTNTATTFALQGFKTAFCGSVGKDYAGFLILMDLKRFKIATNFVHSFENKTTNHSVILSEKEKGRVILVYREASNYLPKNFNLEKLNADWYYLSPLGGQFAKKTKAIIRFAKKNNIKVAFNPSKYQISLFKNEIQTLLPLIDVFLVNEKESKLLFGNYKDEMSLFKKISKYISGYFVITKGSKGSVVFDKEKIYQTGITNVKVTDRTGAGDAYGAGFVTGLIKTNDPIFAIQLATANSGACLKKWGAKEGLLKQNDKYPKIKVKTINFKR